MAYSYGVPNEVIWTMHLIIGFVIAYVGYCQLNNYTISQMLALILIITGVLAMMYHGHLMYLAKQ
jgi:ABC-type transporter Mla maintaining outer membrane lipid asymmetry permease subunit MlaE